MYVLCMYMYECVWYIIVYNCNIPSDKITFYANFETYNYRIINYLWVPLMPFSLKSEFSQECHLAGNAHMLHLWLVEFFCNKWNENLKPAYFRTYRQGRLSLNVYQRTNVFHFFSFFLILRMIKDLAESPKSVIRSQSSNCIYFCLATDTHDKCIAKPILLLPTIGHLK